MKDNCQPSPPRQQGAQVPKPTPGTHLFHILNVRINERNTRNPHGTTIPIGAFPIELCSCWLKHIAALGAQELFKYSDDPHSIAPVWFLLIFLSKPAEAKEQQLHSIKKKHARQAVSTHTWICSLSLGKTL